MVVAGTSIDSEVVTNALLLDHHVHGAFRNDVTDAEFEESITESDRGLPIGQSSFDSQLGYSILRWCAPVLDLDPHCGREEYLSCRRNLGTQEVTRRFLRAACVATFLVDTGYASSVLLTPEEMAIASGADTFEVVRLEALAEEIAAEQPAASQFVGLFEERLQGRVAGGAIGAKSIVAYRYGLDFDPVRPRVDEVSKAVARWLSHADSNGVARLSDPTVLRHLIWTAIDAGVPLQFHTGFGDTDEDLHRANPILLTEFLRLSEAAGTSILLLHCYPFHREAGYLAQMFPHAYFDIGAVINYLGAGAVRLVAESLELAPFAKQLYSSDAWGPPELHFLGALRWRMAIAKAVGGFVDEGEWSRAQAETVVRMIGSENAAGIYGLPSC